MPAHVPLLCGLHRCRPGRRLPPGPTKPCSCRSPCAPRVPLAAEATTAQLDGLLQRSVELYSKLQAFEAAVSADRQVASAACFGRLAQLQSTGLRALAACLHGPSNRQLSHSALTASAPSLSCPPCSAYITKCELKGQRAKGDAAGGSGDVGLGPGAGTAGEPTGMGEAK